MSVRFATLVAAAGIAFAQTSPRLSNFRQLTFGGQNAEAYWSPDGRRLIFQSTHGDYRCDQIFIMNAGGPGGKGLRPAASMAADVRLVSTGKGRTTCGYFLADGKHILYASTHEAGDACPPPADRSKGYVWPLYPSYDIYLATEEGKIVRKLTDAPGYDAEAVVNFKTRKIVYTSLASGDAELWTMNSDGSGKRQITNVPGYDGGAVFSRDGKKLVWRASRFAKAEDLAQYKQLLANNLVSPMQVEIFVADADGKDVKQLTAYGCASFAPTFTPDGKQIVFASNKHACGTRNFELYSMSLDGSGLEQITNFGGFVSFPEFSPDGRKLVFASDWKATGRYEFNIFTADWK